MSWTAPHLRAKGSRAAITGMALAAVRGPRRRRLCACSVAPADRRGAPGRRRRRRDADGAARRADDDGVVSGHRQQHLVSLVDVDKTPWLPRSAAAQTSLKRLAPASPGHSRGCRHRRRDAARRERADGERTRVFPPEATMEGRRRSPCEHDAGAPTRVAGCHPSKAWPGGAPRPATTPGFTAVPGRFGFSVPPTSGARRRRQRWPGVHVCPLLVMKPQA